VIPYNATGDAAGASVWSFTTVADGYLAESFENAAFPPFGWANPGSWSRSGFETFVGFASARKSTSTTASLLCTPMVTITGSSTLKFYAKNTSSNTSQRIQVKHSTDGTTWTNIGDEISLASAGLWTPYSVDLSSLTGNNYYLAIASFYIGSSGSVYLDHVIGPMITPLAPNPVTLKSPANAAINQSITPSLSWTAAATGGLPTAYKIYLDETADPTALIATVAASPYTVSPALDYSTTYYWKVIATNNTGDAVASAIRSFTVEADPILTPPFIQEFGTFPPRNWTTYAGLLANPTSFTSVSFIWTTDGFANVGTTGAAAISIYGISPKDWLITPSINLGDGSKVYRLIFDLALTAKNSTGVAQMTGTDDKFAVVISTDNGVSWSSANTLMLWDNAGSASVYNAIATTGEEITIDLSAYSGIVKIGFYGESTITNAANDLFVDNVTVEEIPSNPVFAVSPESKVYGTINVGESSAQTFTISNTGLGTLGITEVTLNGTNADQFTLSDLNTYPVSLNYGESMTIDVSFEPIADGAKTASLDISDNLGQGIHNVALSGTGYTPPQGSVCSNPLTLTLPATNVTGNTANYGDYYSSTDISPSSPYLNGNDVVYQFILPNGGLLEGTITTTNSYIGAFILADCPNATTPPTPVIQKTSSGKILNYSNDIAAGTYFLIIASFPSPQSIAYTINLSLTEYPAASTWTGSTDNDWHTAGNWNNGVPGFTTDVIIPAGLTNYPTLSSAGTCNDLLIASTATGTASLLDGGFLTVNGDATIQRYINGGGYHNVSVPLAGGATAAAFMNSYLRKFNALGQAWVNITAPGVALNENEGYLIWYTGSNTTYEFTGDLISGNFTVATPAAASIFNAPNYIGGYNLVPNPYPSAIDWNAASGFTENNLFETIWIFNRGTGNYGAYVRAAGSGTNAVSNIIPVGQSFFVQANTAGVGSMTINQAARTHSSNDLLKDGNLTAELLKLKVNANNFSDELIVQFSEGSSMAFEGNRDAQKLRSPGDAPQLYSLTPEGTELSINTIPFSNETIIIPVGFELAANENAVFNFTNLESFDPNITIFLEDLLSGEMIDVREQQVYTFMHDEGNEALRFRLHFKSVVGVDEQQLSAYQVWSYDSKVYISIPALTGDKALIQLIDVQGKVVYEGEHHLSNPEIIN
ncbi:MAG: choice-of-anchor J domain-containing protein, partial [Bacteroidales bacterium]|nr:choice-of-anchor J domain-containing protein [Bacteroidales bacterium]